MMEYSDKMESIKSHLNTSLVLAIKEHNISWEDIMRSFITHVFLPKKLPQGEEPYIEEISAVLLSLLASEIKRFSPEDQPCSTIPRTAKTMSRWTSLQSELRSEFALNKELDQLKIGDTIPLYIRCQNCTILFTKLDKGHMRLMTFRASLPNEVIMSTAGSMKVNYPETVEVVPISELMLSPAFSKHIRNLSFQTCSLALPESEKAGKKFPEQRQPSNPFIISEFLVGMLQPITPAEYNESMKQLTSIKLTKKVRDEVNWDDTTIPFRRSGLWMSAKVVLQLSLLEELGNNEEALIASKIILLETIIQICMEFVKLEPQNWDIISQMMVKLARRARKLSELPNPTNRFESERKFTLEKTFKTIDNLKSIVQPQWDSTQYTSDCEIEAIHLSDVEIRRDVQHNMTALNEYLAKPRLPNESKDSQNLAELEVPRYLTLSSLLESRNSVRNDSSGDIHMNPKTVWIYDVEHFTRNNLNSSAASSDVYTLFCAYTETVVKLYAEEYCDPVSFSRMILTVLKIIRVLDEIAIREHPLLKEYKSGIDLNKFDNLILPQKKEDMEMLESLIEYFNSTNQLADHPCIIGSGFINPSSFSVQYAQQSSEMISCKKNILADIHAAIQRKHSEVRIARAECRNLQTEIDRNSCEYYWSKYYEKNRHSSSCRRCFVKVKLEEKKKSVSYYQRSLPNYHQKEYLQDAVVFELQIPVEIANLRNGLATFLGEICGQNLFDGLTTKNMYETWSSFSDLVQHSDLTKTLSSTVVNLGSTQKSTLVTHYGRENPDVVTQEDNNAFIVDNGLNCRFHLSPNLQFKPKADVLTFQIENTPNFEHYNKLQFSLKPERPTENQIIASQYQCHKKLQLKEFISFGSMRSGHRIQLRNLYAALSNQSISLEQEPVLALILQTIWEVGPKSKEKLREIHIDFYDEAFSLEFLGLCEKILKSNVTNWSCPMVMFAVTLLTIRILELSKRHEVRQFCTKILKMVRVTLETWWVKLENIILNAKGNEKEATQDLEILNELLLQTAVCSAHTFNVTSKRFLKYVIIGDDDLVFWLCTVSRMYHMVVREKAHKNFSKLLLNLVRDARLRIPLNIESYLHNRIQPNYECLHDFTCRQWTLAKTSFYDDWERCEGLHQHVYLGLYVTPNENGISKKHTVYVDVIRGIFLVDGYPSSYLPENIIQHELFNRFFKRCRFQVQRDSRTFTTKNKYMDHHYQFYFTKDSELVIRQVADSNSYLELVPPQLLSQQVSNHFIEDFTHWYSSSTNQVDFRNRSDDSIEYYFCPERKLLMEHSKQQGHNSRKIFSINSERFKRIVRILGRLEYEEFIDVSLEGNVTSKEMIVTANLRRLNLTFELGNGKIYSKNFPGYYIAPKQCFGTLAGLENGFLLEKETIAETSGFKKLFLIQHGDIRLCSSTTNPHQSVVINSYSLRKPPIFTFEVDQILNRLKAGNDKSAWLYLAALHASTSSPFPDAFTGLTGTEMAMWILQSGFSFSCSPYDKECLRTFEMIYKLSPQRDYYPPHLEQMQTIKWPSGLKHKSYAAYDGFGIIVDNLINSSNRLEGLFSNAEVDKNDVNVDEAETSPKLRERSYYRHLNNYNQVAHLEESIIKDHSYLDNVQRVLASMRNPPREWMQLGKVRMEEKFHFIPNNANVESLLITSDSLPPHPELPKKHIGKKPTFLWGTLNDWFSKNLRKNWLHLYTLALQGEALEHEFTIILGALLYFQRGTLEQALNLHNISRLASTYQFPSAVEFKVGFEPISHNYVPNEISVIVKLAAKEFPDSPDEYEKHSSYLEAQTAFNRERDRYISLATRAPVSHWPSKGIEKLVLEKVKAGKFLYLSVIELEVNRKFEFWFNNLQLKLFVNKVDQILEVVRNAATFSVPSCHLQISKLHLGSTADDPDKLGMVLANIKEKEDSITSKDTIVIEVNEKGQRLALMEKAEMVKYKLEGYLKSTQVSKALHDAGIHIRLAPVVHLRSLLQKETTETCMKMHVKQETMLLGIYFSKIRRLSRILHYRTSDIYEVELERELESKPFENWDPFLYLEWFLLELELNVTIRPIQVCVAKHMMNMDGGGVTQLNMGEGKTSVIVPMIVSTLSTRDDLVCRVTVLSSIFTTNFNLLTFTIGGLLNKRLYTLPCRRDYKISQYLPQFHETYLECMKFKGVIMTLPEYKLSFRLMMYNFYLLQKHDYAFQVYHIENWLRQHVLDIVDESDEIFSVKYQLIYTTGEQQNIGGGNMRWIICQKLLQILPEIASKIFDTFGEKVVEFNKDDSVANPEQFTPFRLLSSECKNNLYDLIAEVLLKGNIDLITIILSEQQRKLIKDFLIDENILEEDHLAVLKKNGLEEEMVQILLIISGYLRHGVLFTALTKRWRVECGVNDKEGKLMAVPFRAKDVAAERTEFGHPDMAIVLTQLSYYYSGLNDEQLMETFSKLKNTVGPESLFNDWIQKIPHRKVHDSIKTYKGINLLDFEQRTVYLFPVLRKHKAVIDFWLEYCVYPKECKQFPRKLVMNAWDLSYEKQIHPTTGFSGTNDTKLLLPAVISQNDLEELQKTNETLEATLHRSENSCKRSLKMSTTCRTILEHMKEDGLRVLIDAGALVLDGNEAVANLWLQVDVSLEGVVYFNDKGELVIKTKTGFNDTQLKLSSYNDRLEHCAVYLDDYHTRGTDLKLPKNFKACVTIGSRMRRDKLMQACMRMRKLGKGQSVHFYLSHEASNKIMEMKRGNDLNNDSISTKDILSWVEVNSKEFEKEGLVYWAASAKNYAQKLAADEEFEISGKSEMDGEILAKRCEDVELLSLEETYGTYRSKQKLVDIIPKWFLQAEKKLMGAPVHVQRLIHHYRNRVLNQCIENIPNHEFLFSMLEEEQEKELEPEHEAEDIDETPPYAEAVEPKLHQNVETFVKLGGQLNVKPGILRLSDIFKNASFWGMIQPECWGNRLYATEDFLNVIINPSGGDSFLRPMSYIASCTAPFSSGSVLLLSPFEVNELMPLFQGENSTAVTLHMFSGRYMEGQDTLVNKIRLQLPVSRRGAMLNGKTMAPILIAAGNLFYAATKEQKAFAHFLGLHPRPCQKEEDEAFENGLITGTGFVLPDNPTTRVLRKYSLFQEDPTGMVRAILQCRNDILRDSDHTKQLLNQRAYIEMTD